MNETLKKHKWEILDITVWVVCILAAYGIGLMQGAKNGL